MPARPHREYPEWGGWTTYSLIPKPIYSYRQAKAAVKKLGIKTSHQYRHKRSTDVKLPTSPKISYASEWEGWDVFLDNKNSKRTFKNNYYPNINQAMKAVKKLGIKNFAQYLIDYKKDSKLPSSPKTLYANEWVSKEHFFGIKPTIVKAIPSKYYSTIHSARFAAKSLGATTEAEYAALRHLKPKLPPNPESIYSSNWKGWDYFFALPDPNPTTKIKYKTLAQATQAARKLGAKTAREYIKKYSQNTKLHSNPSVYYFPEWISWEHYLGTESKYYPSLELASKAAIKLKITTVRDYAKRYKNDPKLPSNPYSLYPDWGGWGGFLGK